MPTFCRHNRFIERCPICSKTLQGSNAAGPGTKRGGAASGGVPRSAGAGSASQRRRAAGPGLRVRRETRALDDGYRSRLVPGLRSTEDAQRLAGEIAFAAARLLALAAEPPGLYGRAHELAAQDLEHATWICFLTAYLCPLQGEDPFAGVREAMQRGPATGAPRWSAEGGAQGLPNLEGIPLGPRSSHEPARGPQALIAYLQWVDRGGASSAPVEGTQGAAFTGDPAWSPERRFERLFERLALPGLSRFCRYDLLVTLGRLGLYDVRPDSLALTSGAIAEDPTALAAKRVLGIGDPLLLERRARELADAIPVPVEALDVALANWAAPERATLGFPTLEGEVAVLDQALAALGA